MNAIDNSFRTLSVKLVS